jgi:hypothetical protein
MSGVWEVLVLAQTVWVKFSACLVLLARCQDHACNSSMTDTIFHVFVSCGHLVNPDVYIYSGPLTYELNSFTRAGRNSSWL